MSKILERLNVVVEPNKEDKASRVYDWIMLVAISIGVFPLMFRTQTRLFRYFDVISCLCFVIDYILHWITCGVRSQRKENRWISFLIYPFTPMAIIDMLSILPTVTVLAPAFKIVRVSRLLKILRVVKVIRYFESLEMIIAVIRKQQRILCTVLSLSIFYIFITAIIMFNAEEEINPQTGDYLFHNFFDAFYWAACTLTTVGYGDLYPISNIGRIISVISSMVGIAIIALPSGVITAGYLDELRERKKTEAKEQQEK